MIVRILLAAASFVVAASAFAQQATPPSSATPAAAPAHGCKKPGDHPGKLGSDTQRRGWTKDANGYLECLKKFAMDQQAIAKPLYDQAKPHADAANAAVDEYNKAVAVLKEESEKNN